jgi:hypothetical protein
LEDTQDTQLSLWVSSAFFGYLPPVGHAGVLAHARAATAAAIIMAATARAADEPIDEPAIQQSIGFKPWQAIWQCNDLRITEWSNQQGVIQYDLAGTIWGGSQFARDLLRDTLWFNGRPCARLR